MAKLLYKGLWNADSKYYIDEAVEYNGSMFKSLVDHPVNNPTDALSWTELAPGYTTTFQTDVVSYVDVISLYADLGITTANYEAILEAYDNNMGLYMFPKKSFATAELFDLLGVNFDFRWAKHWAASNAMPNITGFYIMQGSRVKNCIMQGISMAAVESVGFDIDYRYISSTEQYETIGQSTKLGTYDNDAAFPWLDGSNFRMFPVIKINKERKGSGDNDPESTDPMVWRTTEEAPTQLLVLDKNEFIHRPPGEPVETSPYRFAYMNEGEKVLDTLGLNQAKEVSTDKFCIYAPDMLLDVNINVPGIVNLKPRYKVNITRNTSLDTYVELEHYEKYSIHNGSAFRMYMGTQRYPFIYNDGMKRFHDFDKTSYVAIDEDDTTEVESQVIQQNTIASNFYGFSSRMKSIFEVYGDDMSYDNMDQSPTLTAYLSSNRIARFNAGILINRTSTKVEDYDHVMDTDLSAMQAAFSNNLNPSEWHYPYGNRYMTPFDDYYPNAAIPLVATNLSMNSLPYLGVKFPLAGKYLSGATPAAVNLQSFHNAIVDICIYGSTEEYKAAVEASYNLISERYNIIKQYNALPDESGIVLKGDLYSQKTFMRLIHWNTLPESMSRLSYLLGTDRKEEKFFNFEYGWKQGIGVNVYLQSFVNTYLRNIGPESTYYPYILSEGRSGTENDVIDDFVYKSAADKYKNESWTVNEGYKKALGLYQIYAFDNIFTQKTNHEANRIYYSNLHVSGSFVDQYRNIPVNQFQDYNFEGGPIMTLAKFNNYLFSVQVSSINQHYDGNNLQPSDDSSSIILGDKQILLDRFRQLATYGTQHKESIVNGERGIYGVDWDKEKIWRISMEVSSTGSNYFGTINLLDAKLYYDFFKKIKTIGKLPQDVYNSTSQQGIISTYDEKNKMILFTFMLGKKDNKNVYHTLAFSEDTDTFIGFMEYEANAYIKFDNRLFSYSYGVAMNKTAIREHNVGDYLKIDNENKEFIITIIINGLAEDQNTSNFEKEFLSHLINSGPQELSNISWQTEYQSSKMDPFLDKGNFWNTPEYVEGKWQVAITPNEATGKEFFEMEQDGQMRGQWLKVTIKYKVPELYQESQELDYWQGTTPAIPQSQDIIHYWWYDNVGNKLYSGTSEFGEWSEHEIESDKNYIFGNEIYQWKNGIVNPDNGHMMQIYTDQYYLRNIVTNYIISFS